MSAPGYRSKIDCGVSTAPSTNEVTFVDPKGRISAKTVSPDTVTTLHSFGFDPSEHVLGSGDLDGIMHHLWSSEYGPGRQAAADIVEAFNDTFFNDPNHVHLISAEAFAGFESHDQVTEGA